MPEALARSASRPMTACEFSRHFGVEHRGVGAEGAEDDAAEVRAADVTDHREGVVERLLAARDRLGILAVDVVVEAEAQRAGHLHLVCLERLLDGGDVHLRRREGRQLDEVVAGLAGAGDGVFALLGSPAARPYERVHSELVHRSVLPLRAPRMRGVPCALSLRPTPATRAAPRTVRGPRTSRPTARTSSSGTSAR